MKLKRPRSWILWLRRICQAFFLALFVGLVLAARFAETGEPPRLLRFFFDLDPLTALATILATRTLAVASLLALVTVLATLILGRAFCGWVCPLGTVHTMASWFKLRRTRGHEPEISEDGSVAPWIDSPKCTTCEECVKVNAEMFAYDEHRKAYIKNAGAGSYKHLVRAAEQCTEKVIHPGYPLVSQRGEKGVAKLMRRAEKFMPFPPPEAKGSVAVPEPAAATVGEAPRTPGKYVASWADSPPCATSEPPERRSPWQRGKYYVLVALLVMALFGVHWVGVLDPISLLYRVTAVSVLPATQYAIHDGANAIYQADPHLGPLHAKTLSEPVYQFSRRYVFPFEQPMFWGATLIALLFIGIVVLNLVKPRFWCRYICPLGGLLGLLSRRPALRLENNADLCRDCGKCSLACPAAAQPDVRGEWLPTECYACWNCVDACSSGALKFKWEVPWKTPEAGRIDFSKRATLAAGAGGVAALLAYRLPPPAHDGQPFPAKLIRPPGAREEREFLKRCIQCGMCMRVCPAHALHPAGLEGGIEALWTPKLVPKVGFCEDTCNQCGQVCPTEAIQPLPLEEKQEVKMGLATVDVARCLPHNYGRPCLVCEEHCPVSPKAIYLVPKEFTLSDGSKTTVDAPYVDPERCIGCGACEWSCVFQDEAAIRVTTANESRNSNNQPILPGFSGGYG